MLYEGNKYKNWLQNYLHIFCMLFTVLWMIYDIIYVSFDGLIHLDWWRATGLEHDLQMRKKALIALNQLTVSSAFEYIHCNKYQNFNKFQPTDSEL